MQNFSATPQEMLACLWRNRGLIQASAKRDVLGRYRGSVLGLLWSFFNPLLMLLVYTFVFSIVFKSRWSGGSESKIEFALVLFVGLIVFNLFAECINRAPTLILSPLPCLNQPSRMAGSLHPVFWYPKAHCIALATDRGALLPASYGNQLGASLAGCVFAGCFPVYWRPDFHPDVP